MVSKSKKLKVWYEEHERHVSTISLIGGFLFDTFALKRIDSLAVNGWLIGNLLAVAICIILISREESFSIRSDKWKHFWIFNIFQFGTGAILGGSFRFYLRSGTIAGSWPFLLLLVAAILFNEYLRRHYERLVFRLSFLYLSLFVLSIFMLPLVFHRIGVPIFISSGILSLVLFKVYLRLLKKFGREKSLYSTSNIWLSTFIIFGIINVLYFTNLIPPIPLSLKDAGIYHSISVDSQGNYHVSEEKPTGLSRYFKLKEKMHLLKGESLYAYASVFAPGSIATQIVHEWQYKNEFNEWVTATRVPLSLSGGREQGFRTYSTKMSLAPGDWRINVETPRGQLIGRIKFEIIEASESPVLTNSIKD